MKITKDNKREKELSLYIGGTIRAVRINKGFTLEKTAQYLGLRYQQIQKYENGTHRISAPSLFLLSEMFGVDINEFFPKRKKGG